MSLACLQSREKLEIEQSSSIMPEHLPDVLWLYLTWVNDIEINGAKKRW